MATKNDLVQILRELLLNRFAPKPNYVSGLLGNGVGAVVVPERPDYSYVRFNRSTTQVFQIFNKNVSPVDGWPVLIGEVPWQPGLTQVIDTDWGAYEQTGWGDTGPEVSAHGESHEWNDGNPGSDVINVYTRALVPLRTYSPFSGSTTVYAAPLEYEWNETGTFFPGTPGIDFAALINSIPTGTQLFAGVYLDPYTNMLGVITGTQSVYSPAVLPAFPEFPGGVIPSARIRLRGYQVGIAEQNIYDARRLLRPDGSQVGPAGGDLTGTYPNPNVAGLFGYPLVDSAPNEGNVLMFSGSAWRPIPGGQATPSGDAGGDLTGTYPNPTVAGLYGYSLLDTVPAEGYILMFTGSAWRPIPGAGATGAGGAWPADGKAMINTTSYDTLAAAYTAASAGDTIKLGLGIFLGSATLDIIKNITLIGTERKETIIRYGADHVIQVGSVSTAPVVNLYNLTIDYSGTSASFYPLYLDDGTLYCENVDVTGNDFNSASTCRIFQMDAGTATFLDCNLTLANAGASTNDRAINYNSGTLTIYGGVIDGEDNDISGIGSGIFIYGAELINNTYGKTSSTSDFNGWYYYAGRAYQLVNGTIYTPIGSKTSDDDIYQGASVSGSRFISSISGTPSGSTLVYGTVTTGNENVIVPASSSQIAKMVLHNTTRGDSALILSVDTGTNTITLTSAVPGTWAAGDTITTESQTATGAILGVRYFDFEFVSGLNDGASSFQATANWVDSGTIGAGTQLVIHPYAAASTSKRQQIPAQVSGLGINTSTPIFPIIENRFCMAWASSGTATGTLTLRLFAEG